jgi:antitoxin HigA-1
LIPENRNPTHPGVVLEEEYLIPLGLTQVALAKHLGVPTQRVNELIRGKRGVTPETAWLLAGAFKTTPRSSGSICWPIMIWLRIAPSKIFSR